MGRLALLVAAREAGAAFFPPGCQVHEAWAPGRLDVLGGVADYCGGLVLQLPTDQGVLALASGCDDDEVVARTTDRSCGADVALPAATLRDVDGLRRALTRQEASGWAAYALGPLAVLARDHAVPPRGLRLLIHGDLPPGAGAASSAAVEVASLRVACAALGADLDPAVTPLVAQRAEHEVAGAPCGLMDQMAVAFGEPGRLFPLDCADMTRPSPLRVPDDVRLVGVVSGVRHTVAGDAYAAARAAAFMGRAIMNARQVALADLPESRTGDQFLERLGHHGDDLTEVRPGQSYPVRAAATHAPEERVRVSRFLKALRGGDYPEAGRCLDESHESYGAMGLGCEETDRIATAARDMGAYGARISGGGCGGTVVVLADAGLDLTALGPSLTTTPAAD